MAQWKTRSAADVLERELEPAIKEWLRRVNLVPKLINIPLSDRERTSHLPRLYGDLISRLRLAEDVPATASVAATAHGQMRRAQGYTAAMLIDESRVFQVSTFATLNLHQGELNQSRLLLDIMIIADEVDSQLTQTVSSLLAADPTLVTTGFRIEFDQMNKILLMRVEGRLTDESLARLDKASRKYSRATRALVNIVDLSSVTEFAVSTHSIENLACQKPTGRGLRRRCFIVAPDGVGYGLSRMFQSLGAIAMPLLQIVHTVGEACAAIGILTPYVGAQNFSTFYLPITERRKPAVNRTMGS